MDTQHRCTDRRGHVRWPREQKLKLTELFFKSGMSQSEFCTLHEVNPKTFSAWVRAARSGRGDAFVVPEMAVVAPVSFCEVALPSVMGSRREVQVILPNGARVLIPAESPDELGAIFRGAASC